MESISPPDIDHGRRRFLVAATGAVGGVGIALAAWPFIDSMEPSQAAIGAGAPIDVDIGRLEPGQLILAVWRSRPIWILHRTDAQLATLAQNNPLLRDPDSQEKQQLPEFINGDYRSLNPHILIAVAICTHLGCVPNFMPQPETLGPGWPGGFLCPCHGSRYDLSARVFDGSPAPLNIPIPPYWYKSANIVRIGELKGGGAQEWSPSIW